jgi:hypothetical protein
VVGVIGIAAWLYRDHIRFRWEFESLGRKAQGCPEYGQAH